MTSLWSMLTARGAPRVETASRAEAFAGARRFTASGVVSSGGGSIVVLAPTICACTAALAQVLAMSRARGAGRLRQLCAIDAQLAMTCVNHCLLTQRLHSRRRLWLC